MTPTTHESGPLSSSSPLSTGPLSSPASITPGLVPAPVSVPVVAAFAPVTTSAARPRPTPIRPASKADEIIRILAAKEEIERNVAAPLYVAHFANVAGLRPATFSRRFARFVGVTPIRYRLELRIAHARRLLLEQPRQTIAAIAKAVGFEDVRFFHRSFRAVSGVTPVAYRRMHRDSMSASPVGHGTIAQ